MKSRMSRWARSAALIAVTACLIVVPSQSAELNGSGARIIRANDDPGAWLSHGRTYSEERYSPLTSIDRKTVGRLGLAWVADFDTNRGQEATPLIVDGVMYTSTAWSKVYALDAATGRVLWKYDPKVPGETGVKACCDVVNRGVAYWEGRIFVGTLDGRLIALDARTGARRWSVMTVDAQKPYTITGAPRVVKGKVLIGNGGAEFGVRGYVSAYDARSGALAWRFYTVPGDPSKPQENPILESAAKTWKGEWWKGGGGGTVWDSMAYDPELDLLYIGVGNGSPWNQNLRSPGGGDNLFLSSIVALRPDTGDYVWHYQTTPGEMWDYTATNHIVLADLTIGGVERKVLMQAPKNGFFYVLDRATGALLSANPYAPVNWASGVDMKTGRPIMNPDANYAVTGKPWVGMPGPLGAHSWHPMSYSSKTGLVYIPSFELGFAYVPDVDFSRKSMAVNLGIEMRATALPDDAKERADIIAGVRGHLIAWDPVKQMKVWDVAHASAWNGGVLSTAGDLVFQGDATGSFSAYDAQSGEKLWSFPAGEGIVAPPVSYSVKGEQYVAVAVGWGGIFPLLTGEIAHKGSQTGGNGRLIAFKLDGKAQLRSLSSRNRTLSKPAAPMGDAKSIDAGFGLYHRYCSGCHGGRAISGGVLPDLRMSAFLSGERVWAGVVLNGALKGNGMAGFGTELSAADSEAIRSYVIDRAIADYAVQR
ncbi:MAG: PQQ-dependent dehydrogenase, methanol/ethanol family [Pseudomonadota bacterium]